MRFKTLVTLGGSLAMIGSLSGCGGSSGSGTPTPTPTATPTPATIQSQISAAFATIFNASTTAEPVDPSSDSVPPLAPASQPVDF